MLDNDCKLAITIEVSDEQVQLAIGTAIHEQLRGNKDYIDSNIILNIGEPNIVKLYVFKECEHIPAITI